MYFIQKREWSPKAERFGLMEPFKTKFAGKHLPMEVDDVLHNFVELRRVLATMYGDGYFYIQEKGGRGRIINHFTGNCSAFF
jgi:hypothetical protein